eukprot:SAG31_NODE_913_length_11064_cov_4.529594_5_plen_739_part_00
MYGTVLTSESFRPRQNRLSANPVLIALVTAAFLCFKMQSNSYRGAGVSAAIRVQHTIIPMKLDPCVDGVPLIDSGVINFTASMYSNTQECMWELSCSNPAMFPALTFFDLHASHSFDYLHLYDGDSIDATELSNLHGSIESFPLTKNATGTDMLVRFASDGNVSGDAFSAAFKCSGNQGAFHVPTTIGPVANITAIDLAVNPCVDGVPLIDSGVINFTASMYSNTQECMWELSCSNPAMFPALTFFDLHASHSFDYLHLYDGDSIDATELSNLHGSIESFPLTKNATGTDMLVRFASDGNASGDAFSAAFKCRPSVGAMVTSDSVAASALGLTKSTAGPAAALPPSFSNANLPLPKSIIQNSTQMAQSSFPSSSNPCDGGLPMLDWGYIDFVTSNFTDVKECLWELSCSDATKTPALNFSSFQSEHDYDYVFIYDGDSSSDTQISRLHGKKNILPFLKVATGVDMLVRFSSDGDTTADGFLAQFTCIPAEGATRSSATAAIAGTSAVANGTAAAVGDLVNATQSAASVSGEAIGNVAAAIANGTAAAVGDLVNATQSAVSVSGEAIGNVAAAVASGTAAAVGDLVNATQSAESTIGVVNGTTIQTVPDARSYYSLFAPPPPPHYPEISDPTIPSLMSKCECVFPFFYNSSVHEDCIISVGYNNGRPWCATTVNAYGQYDGSFGDCGTVCPNGPRVFAAPPPSAEDSTHAHEELSLEEQMKRAGLKIHHRDKASVLRKG